MTTTVWIGGEVDGELRWRSESHEDHEVAEEVGHDACRIAVTQGREVVVLFEQGGMVASYMVTFSDDPDETPWWSHRECESVAIEKAKASAWELEHVEVVGNYRPGDEPKPLDPIVAENFTRAYADGLSKWPAPGSSEPEPADPQTLALVAELDQKAARDVLARAVVITIERNTVASRIVDMVCEALTAGRCVRLGRLALQAWPNSPVVRDLASNDDDARNDTEKWATTARVRQTLSVAGGEEYVERIAQAFVLAWTGDWKRASAAPVKVKEVEA